MAELVDALASGASVPRDVEVQVLSSVPKVKDGSFDPSFTFDVLYERLEPLRDFAKQNPTLEGREAQRRKESTKYFLFKQVEERNEMKR